MRSEINYKKDCKTYIHTWKLNNMLLNKQRGKKEIPRDENKSTIIQNLWDTAKSF